MSRPYKAFASVGHMWQTLFYMVICNAVCIKYFPFAVLNIHGMQTNVGLMWATVYLYSKLILISYILEDLHLFPAPNCRKASHFKRFNFDTFYCWCYFTAPILQTTFGSPSSCVHLGACIEPFTKLTPPTVGALTPNSARVWSLQKRADVQNIVVDDGNNDDE